MSCFDASFRYNIIKEKGFIYQRYTMSSTHNTLIAVDMDEVLTETAKWLLKFHDYKFFGKILKYEWITNYRFQEIPWYTDASKEYALTYFVEYINSAESKDTEIVLWAKEKLENLKKIWYRFVVITGRAINVETATRAYLEKYYPNIFEEVYFCAYDTPNQKDKYTVCQELGITTIIEDHLANSIKYAQQGIEVILLDKPRNQDYNPQIHKHITKVKSWDEITIQKSTIK